jgi:hypothetical protein
MPSAVPQSLWKDYIQSLEQARLQRQEAWGGWRHFVASRAASRDARAIRLVQRRDRERSHEEYDRGL